jgi:hypothetical protein
MAASFVSGVSAFANMLKLLRRPLTIAVNHVLKCDKLPSSEVSCAPVSGSGKIGNEGRQLRAREKGLEVQKNRPRLPKDAASPNLYLMRCSHDSIGLRRGTKRE